MKNLDPDKRIACPCCDESQHLDYSVFTDEYTCSQCGLVSTVNEARAHFDELIVMTLRPLHDQILIKPSDPEDKSSGGLVIPESARRQEGSLVRGKVLAVGSGDRGKDGARVPLETQPGDEVLYYRNPSTEVSVDGINGKCVVIHEEQYAVAVIEP